MPAKPAVKVEARDGQLPRGKDPEIRELRRMLGLRIRDLRQQRGYTLSDVAAQTGVTTSALSQFENGHAEPSLTTLWKLSRVLGAAILELPSNRDPIVDVTRQQEERSVLEFGNYRYTLLTEVPTRRMDFFLLEIDPGEGPIRGPLAHTGEDCGYVLRGQVDVVIEDQTYTLKKGDAIWFVATQPHTFIPRGTSPSLSVWANSLTSAAALGKGAFAGLHAYLAEPANSPNKQTSKRRAR